MVKDNVITTAYFPGNDTQHLAKWVRGKLYVACGKSHRNYSPVDTNGTAETVTCKSCQNNPYTN